MNILRAILITLLVTAASLGALLIPLNSTSNREQPPRATAATISLVDSLPSVPAQPKTTRAKTEIATPSLVVARVEEPLLPPSEEGIAPIESSLDPLNQKEDPVVDKEDELTPSLEEDAFVSEDSLPDSTATEASLASVATSAVSDPLPSLVDGYYEATGVDRGPSFNRADLASRIRYPSLAKRQGIEGLVMLRLFISDSGKVERIEVEEDPGYGLAEAAVKAFTDLQGEPALLEGKAVPVTLRYPVRFSLQ